MTLQTVKHCSPISEYKSFDFVEGANVWELAEANEIPINVYPTIVIKNGEPLMRKDWHLTIDAETVNDLTFLTMPQGGAFKDILRIVATLALAFIAPYAAGPLAGVLGITSTFGISLIQAGVFIAGSYLINSLLGPTAPSQQDSEAASPTYSINAQGNSARLYAPVPKLYGTHLLYPDFAAQPYSSYKGNDQFLYQLFCLGVGQYDVEKIRIEDTDLWIKGTGFTGNFESITFEIVPPGSKVNLFPSQVISSIEVSGQDMANYEIEGDLSGSGNRVNGEQKDMTQLSIGQKINLNGTATLYTITDKDTDGKWVSVTPNPPGSISRLDLSLESQWAGPFVANPANTVAYQLEFDFVLPQGLYYANDEGGIDSNTVGIEIQVQLINSAGIAIGSWLSVNNQTIKRSTVTPQRITVPVDVPDGRWQARVRRTTSQSRDNRKQSTIQWTGLKAYLPNDNIYPNVTLLAMVMRASGQLSSSSSRKVNTIQTSMLRGWNGSTWSAPAVSRSIAWAVADILRDTVSGAGYQDSAIDLDKLLALHATWTARGDYFDAVYDTSQSVWDALGAALRAGRSYPIQLGGLLSFMRDEARDVPATMFTPSNIVRNSFETQHILFDDETPDDIIIEFTDNRTWRKNEVQCTLPDSLSAQPERKALFGVTDRLHAWREGIFMAAVNARRRTIAKFSTELEGRLLVRGDSILAAHDLYNWGKFGQILGYDSVTRFLDIDRSDLTLNGLEYLFLRKRNGSLWGPVRVAQISGNVLQINSADLTAVQAAQGSIVNTFATDDDAVLTHFVIAKLQTDYKKFIVISGTPQKDTTDLVVMNDDPSVHTADQATPPSEVYPYTPPKPDNRPKLLSLSVSSDVTSTLTAPVLNISWTPDGIIPQYVVQVSYDGASYDTVYNGAGTTFQYAAFPGAIWIRVAGVSSSGVRGTYRTFTGTFGTPTTTPLPASGITIDASVAGGTLRVDWIRGLRATAYKVDIYSESSPGVYSVLELSSTTESLSMLFTSADILTAGGPWPNVQARVTSLNASGSGPVATANKTGIALNPILGLSLPDGYSGNELQVQWSPAPIVEFYAVQLYVKGVLKGSFTSTTNAFTFSNNRMNALGGPFSAVEVRVAANYRGLSSPAASISTFNPNFNFVQNGTFDTDTIWTKPTGATISGGVANKSTGAVGALTAPLVEALISGATYELSYNVATVTGAVTPFLSGGASNLYTARNSATGSPFVEAKVATAAHTTIQFSVNAVSGWTGLDNVVLRRTA